MIDCCFCFCIWRFSQQIAIYFFHPVVSEMTNVNVNHKYDRIVVLVDMDCFYCQVEEQLNPALIGKPVAVVQYNAWKGGGYLHTVYKSQCLQSYVISPHPQNYCRKLCGQKPRRNQIHARRSSPRALPGY